MSAEGISVTMPDGVVAVAVEVDMATAPILTKALDEVSGQLILDLRAVSFMDSSGVRVLAAQRLQRSTDVHDCRVVALSPQVRRVLARGPARARSRGGCVPGRPRVYPSSRHGKWGLEPRKTPPSG